MNWIHYLLHFLQSLGYPIIYSKAYDIIHDKVSISKTTHQKPTPRTYWLWGCTPSKHHIYVLVMDHLQIKLQILMTFTYHIQIIHSLAHWNPLELENNEIYKFDHSNNNNYVQRLFCWYTVEKLNYICISDTKCRCLYACLNWRPKRAMFIKDLECYDVIPCLMYFSAEIQVWQSTWCLPPPSMRTSSWGLLKAFSYCRASHSKGSGR